ncbi:MAG: T9SS type A sorting domain-containing protein [Flavobacteriales bacterium]
MTNHHHIFFEWIGENSNSNILDSLSSGIYTVVVENSIGCIDTLDYFVQSTEISVYANSSIDESLQDETIEGVEVSLYANTFSAAQPVTYEWLPSEIVNTPDSLYTSASIHSTTTFTLIMHDANGCLGIDSVIVFIDNTNEITHSREDFSINIYPLPTKGKLTIENGGSISFSQIKITDNLGKEVQFHLEELNGSYELFLDQPKGVYFVHFWNQNNSFSRKILLE